MQFENVNRNIYNTRICIVCASPFKAAIYISSYPWSV